MTELYTVYKKLSSNITIYRHTWFYCALLLFSLFYKLKVSGNPELSKSTGATFPTAFAHFMSLRHILVILTIFQTFSSLLYLLRGSVISDL